MAVAPLLVALVAAVLVAVVVPLCAPVRRRAAVAHVAPDRHADLCRIRAHVHMGWEQTLIGLARELRLPHSRDDLPYGALYLEPRSEHRQQIRTRSEIGRGFLGLLDVEPHAGPTSVAYSVLRLPDDEQLHGQIQQFEHDLLAALHRLDPHLTVDVGGR